MVCDGSDGKESACSAGDPGLIPGLGRYFGGGNGNPLQYWFLENSWGEEPGGLQSMRSQRVSPAQHIALSSLICVSRIECVPIILF